MVRRCRPSRALTTHSRQPSVSVGVNAASAHTNRIQYNTTNIHSEAHEPVTVAASETLSTRHGSHARTHLLTAGHWHCVYSQCANLLATPAPGPRDGSHNATQQDRPAAAAAKTLTDYISQ
ncbi:uncharacterized protein LOC126577000 [Anopheles aquasalis]|uniref:uncharacterized protein LOC126577000 n=1 Tax=Anopheles aquasalis TaxID=42839 RepID=UPI00215A38E6|nr:uncharacterized protein LOC126577000 [Anopheles aquasalis]